MAFIGIDIGGTNVDIGVVSDEGKVLHWASIPTEVEQGPTSCMERIVKQAEELAAKSKDVIEGIGIGFPGPLDIGAGKMITVPNFPKSWIGYPIRDELSKQLGLPAEIDNDANAAALGELWVGGGRGVDDFVVLTLGTGIGSGIIANGKIVRGSKGYGAELGHTCVYPDGRVCKCGKQGCLEAYASATSVIDMARQLLLAPDYQKGSSSLEKRSPESLDAQFIFEQARIGDRLAVQVIKKAGQALGISIGTLLNTFNPKKVILAGRIAQSMDLLKPYIEEESNKHAFDTMVKDASIETSCLGNHTGLIGAAAVFAYEQGMINKTPLIYPAPQPYTIAAIHVGASGIRVAIVNINEDCRSYDIVSQEHTSGKQPNEETILDTIKESLKETLSKSSKKLSDLKGFSVMSAGPIDRKNKEIINPPNVAWSYVNLKTKLYRKINKPENIEIPLYLEGDAIAVTLAEQYFGHGRNLKNFATIYIGTGIGAGLILNGKLFYGAQDHAGEFGHGIIDWNSKRKCHCGKEGCLECFASGWSLINYCTDAMKSGTTSVLSDNMYDLHYSHILEAANRNDLLAFKAFKQMGEALGIGLSILINYLDLEKVIISGPLARGSQHYLDKVRKTAAKNIITKNYPEEWSKNNIVATKIDDEEIEIAGAVAAFINQHTK